MSNWVARHMVVSGKIRVYEEKDDGRKGRLVACIGGENRGDCGNKYKKYANLIAAAPELLSLAHEVPCSCEREYKNPEKVITQCERCTVIKKASGAA